MRNERLSFCHGGGLTGPHLFALTGLLAVRQFKPRARQFYLCFLVALLSAGCHSFEGGQQPEIYVLPMEDSLFARGVDEFYEVKRAVVAFDSLVAVADRYSGKIFLLRDFQIERAVGGVGQGPLEFTEVGSLVPLDEALAVYDHALRRVTILDSSLQLRRQLRAPVEGAALTGHRLGPRGLALLEHFPKGRVLWTTDLLAPDSVRWQAIPDSVLGPAPPEKSGLLDGIFFDGGQSPLLRYGWTHEYRIYSLDPDTRVRTLVAQREIPRPTLTADEVEQERERSAAAAAASGVRLTFAVQDTLPHFANHFEDSCQRLWVRTYRGEPEQTILDLFGPDGSVLAEVTLEAIVIDLAGFLDGASSLIAVVRSELSGLGLGRFGLPPALVCHAET